jgi:hypothetical protein
MAANETSIDPMRRKETMAGKKSSSVSSYVPSFRLAGFSARMVIFLASGTFTILWFAFGYPFMDRLFGGTRDPLNLNRKLDQMTAKLMKNDPVAAAEITKLRENREINKLGLVNSLLVREQMGGTAGMRSMLVHPSGEVPSLVRLCSLGADPNGFSSAEKQKDFLDAHLTFLEILERAGASILSDSYVDKLAAAKQDPALWPYVVDDALAVLVFDKVTDPDLRAYYVKERANEWIIDSLMETLAAIAMPGEEVEDSPLGQEANADADLEAVIATQIHDFLRMARSYEPTFAQAMQNPNSSPPLVFQLFEQFGDIIHACVKQRSLPLDETLEIVFANQDYFPNRKSAEKKTPEDIAARMALIRNGKPNVWQAAKREVFVLRLEKDVPDKAERILQKFQGGDIATFLYTGYEDEIVYAADAVDKFGDLALIILNRYHDTTGFKELLRKDARIIPYMAQFGNAGLERLGENRGWMDKYFDKDGLPKEPEWWTKVPIVGAPADVMRNWATGTPSEWSDLGWAALDVTDGVILVMTFGGSAVLTGTARQAVQTGAKQTARRAGQAAATTSLKGSRNLALKETLLGRARTVVARAGAEAVEQAVKYRLVRYTVQGGLAVYGFARTVGQVVVLPLRSVMAASKGVVATWKSLSPLTKRIVYRSMLACGLYATLSYRTMPMLKEKWTGAVETVGRTFKQFQDVVRKISSGDLSPLTKTGRFFAFVGWLAMLGTSFWVTWRLRPRELRMLIG